MSAYLYPIALGVISLLTMTLERLFPKREQAQFRPDLWSDFVHLVFNGHFLGVMLYGLGRKFLAPYFDAGIAAMGWTGAVYRNAAEAWPIWAQIIVSLLVIDFMQWCVHNLLHRVPALWELHKTHHSVKNGEMDWIVAFRFQWTEVVVYRVIQYLPLAYFGFGYEAVMVHAIFGTLIGHLNHANLDWDWGPLRYVLNNPKMHIWHHDYEGDAKTTVNFGIIFSMWDYLFGTAKVPAQDPPRIGFTGVETFPRDFFAQSLWPLQLWVPALRHRRLIAMFLGAVLIGGGYFAATSSHVKRVRVDMSPAPGPD